MIWRVAGSVLGIMVLAGYRFCFKSRTADSSSAADSWNLSAASALTLFAELGLIHRVPGPVAAVGGLAAFVFAIPVFFAGLLFAAEFRLADSPAAALGANMLGAVVGGLLENVSLVLGLKALLLLAAVLYALAGIGSRGLRPQQRASLKTMKSQTST